VKQISSFFTIKSHNKKESLSPLRLFCPRVLTPTLFRVAAAVAAPKEDISAPLLLNARKQQSVFFFFFFKKQRACVMCGIFFFSESKKRAFRSFAREEKKTSQKLSPYN